MKKPLDYITIPAAPISKAEFATVYNLHGACNANALAGHAPGTLELVCYVGDFNAASRAFTGGYRFSAAEPGGLVHGHAGHVPELQFSTLPGLDPPESKKKPHFVRTTLEGYE